MNETRDRSQKAHERRDVRDRGEKARSSLHEKRNFTHGKKKTLLDRVLWLVHAQKRLFHYFYGWLLRVAIAKRKRFVHPVRLEKLSDPIKKLSRAFQRVSHEKRFGSLDDDRGRDRARDKNRQHVDETRSHKFKKCAHRLSFHRQ